MDGRGESQKVADREYRDHQSGKHEIQQPPQVVQRACQHEHDHPYRHGANREQTAHDEAAWQGAQAGGGLIPDALFHAVTLRTELPPSTTSAWVGSVCWPVSPTALKAEEVLHKIP